MRASRAHDRGSNPRRSIVFSALEAVQQFKISQKRKANRALNPISVDRATRLLGVSRSGFYKWLGQSKNEPVKGEDIVVRNELQKVAVEFPAYGYRRITAELKNRGYTVNHKRVLRLMREDNLLCVRKRFKPKTTDSDHNLRTYPNLIKDLKITRLNQVWASDITYIRLPREFVYLAVVLDLFSRRCIGWNIDRSLYTELALSAMTMANLASLVEKMWFL